MHRDGGECKHGIGKLQFTQGRGNNYASNELQ